MLAFDERAARRPAEDFVAEVLAGVLGARSWSSAPTSTSATSRHGDVALLQRMGAELGFEVLGLGLVASLESEDGPTAVCRTRRPAAATLLAAATSSRAAAILGRPHEVRGSGRAQATSGRGLGFPTANVAVPERIVPARRRGLRGHVHRRGRRRTRRRDLARPPADLLRRVGACSLLEAHLLDFDGDLYGQHARVRFLHRLRGQERFDSVDDAHRPDARGRRRGPGVGCRGVKDPRALW